MSGNELLELPELNGVPLSTAHAVSSLALNFALKWHDMRLIKDGAMYQQKKLEGENFQLIDLADVFETAKLIELHILGSPNRLSQALIEGVAEVLLGDDPQTAAERAG